MLAGPFCCHQLAHMGAEVIKVEVPGSGDLARQLGADPDLNNKLMGVSFLAQNTGKRSITINLKSTAGRSVFRRLVNTSQVLVENFRPGVMDRLGVGYESLKKELPGLIYCAISGFGQDGPLRDVPAYDQIIQGMAGVMSITGDAAGAPLRVGYPMADTIGGMTAAFAISSALADRGRQQGCFIDVSMLEAVMATMGWVVSNYLLADKSPLPMGNDNFTASPSGTFRTGDGMINIAANKQEQFEALCHVLDRRDLIEDARFRERQQRLAHRAELSELLEASLAKKSAAVWCGQLNEAGVPAGPVLDVVAALKQPQFAERDMLATYDNTPGVDRQVQVVRPGIRIDGQPLSTERAPPALGEDTLHILAELGYSDDEIAQLQAGQAI